MLFLNTSILLLTLFGLAFRQLPAESQQPENSGYSTCSSLYNQKPNTTPLKDIHLEASSANYLLRFTQTIEGQNRQTIWKLNNNLVIMEAETDGMPWNLVAYDRTPVSIDKTGKFNISMQVSTRSYCSFSGRLKFMGKTRTLLFGKSS